VGILPVPTPRHSLEASHDRSRRHPHHRRLSAARSPGIVATIGWILLIIGLVLLVLGQVGRPVGGRRYWY
jgi:hypothetical protein